MSEAGGDVALLSRVRNAVFDGCPRGEHDIILVAAHHVGLLAGQDADHAEIDVVEPHFLADRISVFGQSLNEGLPMTHTLLRFRTSRS